ncbi:MAG: histidine phosphatase family protein [Patescibacteria group bacterium]|jgi:broad specificity phosphatase PhoE
MLQQLKDSGKKIIFVRHGESIGNAKGLDDESLVELPNHRFPLTLNGQNQAHHAGRALKIVGLSWEQAFFSSYLRTEQTLQGITEVYNPCGLKPIMDSRLDEWWRGIWHTMSKADIVRLYPLEEQIQKREGWYHYRAPGGQSGPDVELQIRSFLNDFFYGCYSGFKTILVVGHGKWGILFWRLIMDVTIDKAKERLQLMPFGNCHISIFSGIGENIIAL